MKGQAQFNNGDNSQMEQKNISDNKESPNTNTYRFQTSDGIESSSQVQQIKNQLDELREHARQLENDINTICGGLHAINAPNGQQTSNQESVLQQEANQLETELKNLIDELN